MKTLVLNEITNSLSGIELKEDPAVKRKINFGFSSFKKSYDL